MADSIASMDTNTISTNHTTEGGSGVEFLHPEYEGKAERWELIGDVLEGEDAVKEKRELYLPKNNPTDTTPQNKTRYNNFLARAVFYGVCKRTLNTLLGIVFSKKPKIEVPESLAYVEDDIDGNGVSIFQQSRQTLRHVLAKGRAGLLVDYPAVDGAVSRFDQNEGFTRATCIRYTESQITNWRTSKIGSKHLLSLVVLKECDEVIGDDGFSVEYPVQYRVLKLQNLEGVEGMIYTQEIYKQTDSGFESMGEMIPRSNNGNPWKFIPFTFVGSVNNDSGVDDEPMYDMASLNIAHYKNSASYENSIFWVGEPQAVIAGLTEDWADRLKDEGMYIGSAAPMTLPVGATYELVQAQPNTLVAEAMDKKMDALAALGARMITKGEAPKTATEAQGDSEAETSIAALIAANVSEAYNMALSWMEEFNSGTDSTIIFEINQDYINLNLDPQVITALLNGIMQNSMPKSALFDYLRKRSILPEDMDDEKILEELENQIPDDKGLDLDADDKDDDTDDE